MCTILHYIELFLHAVLVVLLIWVFVRKGGFFKD
jgi:hypothetical protein